MHRYAQESILYRVIHKVDEENLQNYSAGKDLAALLGLLLERSRGVEKRRSGGSLPVA
jgi:hypothetical protein